MSNYYAVAEYCTRNPYPDRITGFHDLQLATHFAETIFEKEHGNGSDGAEVIVRSGRAEYLHLAQNYHWRASEENNQA